MIDDLINLSKIETSSLQLQPEYIHISQLLTDCFRDVESQGVAKDIELELHLPERLASLEVDKELMRMAIINLLSNALTYTPAGGHMTLRAEESQDEVTIHVQDTGMGIAEADLPHIFERFYRARNGAQTTEGSGLGLTLAHQITQLHGGALTVNSQLEQGSHFVVTLPYHHRGVQLTGVGRQSDEDPDC